MFADEGMEMPEGADYGASPPGGGAEGANVWARQTTRPQALQRVVRVRRYFPESWLWTEVEIL